MTNEFYRELNKAARQLRTELGHPVSIDEVLDHLLTSRRLKTSDFAGAWRMNDEELRSMMKTLRRFWSRWKYPREQSSTRPSS